MAKSCRVLALVVIAAASGTACKSDVLRPSPCKSGEVELGNDCVVLCQSMGDCPEGIACVGGICQPVAPQISGVDGDGTSDPSPDHAQHRVRRGLVIHGRGLANASVSVMSEAGARLDLERRIGGADDRIEVDLPMGFVEGRYRLQVVNDYGEDEADVYVLQGEPGVDGTAGPAGLCDDSTCNSSTVFGLDDLSVVVARAGDRSLGLVSGLSIDGAELIGDAPDGDLVLLLLQREGHAFVDDTAPVQIFSSSDAAQVAQLEAILDTRTQQELAILLGLGGLQASDAPALVDAMLSLGAAPSLRDVELGETFIFAGYPGLGVGNGTLVVSGTGAAEAVVLIAAGEILGANTEAGLGRTIESVEITDGTIALADLADVGCGPGEVLGWDGTAWACATDAGISTESDPTVNALARANLGCAAGEVVKFDGSAWACATDVNDDNDTLAALSCAVGEIPKFDGASWACGADIDTDTNTDTNTDALAALSCSADEIPRFDGAAWICATDDGLTTELDPTVNELAQATLACLSGEIAKFDGASWYCGADEGLTSENDPSVNALGKATLTCGAGEVAKYDGSAWGCGSDADTNTDTLATLSCGAGQVAKHNGTAWSCGADIDTDTDTNTDTLASLGCGNGQVPKYSGGSWGCGTDVDTDTNTDVLGGLSCSNGQVAKYNGSQWTCGSDAGITGSGSTNRVAKFTGSGSIGNSQLTDNGTNVGVGTTAPAYKLDVSGTSRVTGRMAVQGGLHVGGTSDPGVDNLRVDGVVQVGGAVNSLVHYGNRGRYGAAAAFGPDGNDNGTMIESGEPGESAGIFMNGDTLVMWSPGDADLLRVYDEDSFSTGPRFTVDGSGWVKIKDDDIVLRPGDQTWTNSCTASQWGQISRCIGGSWRGLCVCASNNGGSTWTWRGMAN